MAEPLLKRTFSRLRGRNGSRRKTDPADVPVTLTEPSSTLGTAQLPPAQKQQWVLRGSVGPPTLSPNLDQRSCCPAAETWTQRSTQDLVQVQVKAKMWADSCTSGTPDPIVSSKVPLPSATSATSVSTKFSDQRSYLQSLDRSSRAWVLSTGKSQERVEKICGRWQENCTNIWYNPIPEDEEAAGRQWQQKMWRSPVQREEDVSRMWDQTEEGPREPGTEDNIWTIRDQKAEPGVPNGETVQVWGGSSGCTDGPLEDSTLLFTDPSASESGPTCLKKEVVSSSVIDRLRSPSTVHKLSLKMKKLPELRRKLSLRSSSRTHRQESDTTRRTSTSKTTAATPCNQNVISRYHLDSSTPPARPLRCSLRGRSVSKGGHLSDGDSPELQPRQQTHTVCDMSSFQLYVDSSYVPHCSQQITGLLTVHLLGLEDMKTSRSEDSKDIFLAIQIDGVTRARTAPLSLCGSALSLNHTFHLQLERSQQLQVVVITSASKHGSHCPIRNRLCGVGRVSIPPLFKGAGSQQLCVKLEPRGLVFVKLLLQENWDTLPGNTPATTNVFGVELRHLVEEEASASPVPVLIQKTVAEIERRGLKVVGLYRLCGSAAVKKELRDWFERNTSAVCLSEDLYPDINVVTGILKDFLRELPSPLITTRLYHVVREAMTRYPPPVTPDPQLAQSTVGLLSCLPSPERATLSLLLDHLSLVASFSSFNRMTHQNLAVCFGPVLLTPPKEAWRQGEGARGLWPSEELASTVDFKRHIEALHYLLQLWPVPTHRTAQVQHTWHEEEVVVSRRGRGGPARLESPPPINRYAGDWSETRRELVSAQEDDYDEVAGSESDGGSVEEEGAWLSVGGGNGGGYVDEFVDVDSPFNCRLSLKDFDTLIHDLDRELANQIHICF